MSFAEWLPGAESAILYGDFNNWNDSQFQLKKNEWGVFEGQFSASELKVKPGDKYKLKIKSQTGAVFDRNPAYAKYLIQNEQDHSFTATYYKPEYKMTQPKPKFNTPLRIYECHVGISSPEPRIATYAEFTKKTLPYIKSLGYNAIQLMAIPEHAYYGSFGYHVTNYFAPSSRFGTPDDLKKVKLFLLFSSLIRPIHLNLKLLWILYSLTQALIV